MEDYEKKYKEALNRAKKWYYAPNADKMPTYANRIIKEIFPELKESEDEKIRKALVRFHKSTIDIDGIKGADILAWLEKQCYTKKDVDDAYLKGICDAKNELEKQGEQKTAVTDFNAKDWYVSKVDGKIHDMTYNPADKVEPKFKIGDYIVNDYCAGKVVALTDDAYLLDTEQGIPFSCEHNVHLWTIQDAKDGDVVVDKSDGTIGIFESIGHHPDGGSFNDPSYCFLHCRYDDGYFFADFEDGNMMTSDDVIPATQEQRDLLFQKIEEAGYQWNAEKKELKKIEPQPSAWSDEDEENLQHCCMAISKDGLHTYEDKQDMEAWLKSLKDRMGG